MHFKICELRDLHLRLEVDDFGENMKVEIVSPNSSINVMLDSAGVEILSNIATIYSPPLRIAETLNVGKRKLVLEVYFIFAPNIVVPGIKKSINKQLAHLKDVGHIPFSCSSTTQISKKVLAYKSFCDFIQKLRCYSKQI